MLIFLIKSKEYFQSLLVMVMFIPVMTILAYTTVTYRYSVDMWLPIAFALFFFQYTSLSQNKGSFIVSGKIAGLALALVMFSAAYSLKIDYQGYRYFMMNTLKPADPKVIEQLKVSKRMPLNISKEEQCKKYAGMSYREKLESGDVYARQLK